MNGFLSLVVSRPIGAAFVAIAVAVLGWIAGSELPRALLPPVESPVVTVRIDQDGAAPNELEEQLLDPLERTLATVPGMIAMEGRATTGAVEVQLALAAEVDLEATVNRLRERLAGFRRPRGASEPRILRYDPADEPLMRLVLRAREGGPDLIALGVAAREEIAPRLEGLADVAAVLVRGSSGSELRIEPKPGALDAAGLVIGDLVTAVEDALTSRSIGSVATSDGRQQVRLRGAVTRPVELSSIPVRGGVRLGDVAILAVVEADASERASGLLSGETAAGTVLVLEILTQAQASLVAASDDLKDAFDEMGPRLGDGRWSIAGGEMLLLEDRAAPIRAALDDVFWAVLYGALFALAVLVLFLRSLRPAIIVFLAVPLSVFATFLAMGSAGVGLNLMSLGGLALGIGMLVDNAIVVLEAGSRPAAEATRKRGRQQAVATSVAAVASAVIASTATTVAVFLPLVFLPGLLGDLLFDQAFTVSASLLASLVVALALVPPLQALPRAGDMDEGRKLSLPSVHGGYDLPLSSAWMAVWWYTLLLLLPASLALGLTAAGLGVDLFGLPAWALAIGPVLLVLGGIGLLAMIPARAAVQLAWWRLLFLLPIRLLTLSACVLRAWLLLPLLACALVSRGVLFVVAVVLKPVGRVLDRCLVLTVQPAVLAANGLITLAVRQPLLGIAAFIAAGGIGWWCLERLPTRLMPPSTSSRFVLDVDLPRTSTIEDGRNWAEDFLAARSAAEPGLAGVALIGEDTRYAPTLIRRDEHQLRFNLVRPQRAQDMAAEARWVADLEHAAIAAGARSASTGIPPLVDLGGQGNRPLSIALRGGQDEAMRETALAWIAALRADGARGISSSADERAEEVLIVGDSSRLLDAGITWQQLRERVSAAAELAEVNGWRPRYDGENPSPTALAVRIHGPLRNQPAEALAALDVGDGSRPVPLSSVARIDRTPADSIVLHRDGLRVVTVAAAGLPPGDADGASTVRRLAKEIPLPPGTEVVDFGLAPLTNASLDAMLAMLGLSVFLVLVVMAVQFESLSQPLLVLLAVPMAGAGALPALLLTGNGFDVMSGIGLVILAGISVNNAIVLVTTANQRRDAGEAPDLAISAAAKERLRPILMTTTTTILGLAPLAIGWGEGAELRVPLAIAVMGGLLSSTVLVLIALPSVLRLVSRRATGS